MNIPSQLLASESESVLNLPRDRMQSSPEYGFTINKFTPIINQPYISNQNHIPSYPTLLIPRKTTTQFSRFRRSCHQYDDAACTNPDFNRLYGSVVRPATTLLLPQFWSDQPTLCFTMTWLNEEFFPMTRYRPRSRTSSSTHRKTTSTKFWSDISMVRSSRLEEFEAWTP